MTASTLEQVRSHLKMANDARLAMSEIKHEVASGELTVAQALFDPRARSLTIGCLLTSQVRWGDTRAGKLLAELEIRENKKVRELTTRQRVIIIDELNGDDR